MFFMSEVPMYRRGDLSCIDATRVSLNDLRLYHLLWRWEKSLVDYYGTKTGSLISYCGPRKSPLIDYYGPGGLVPVAGLERHRRDLGALA